MRQLAVGCVLCCVVMACGAEEVSSRVPRRGGGASGSPAAMSGQDANGTPGFGSSPTSPVNVVAPPEPDPATPANTGPCAVGSFCPPQGPDPDNCGTLRLEQDVEITKHGTILIVFDQSASMQEPWGQTGTSKLQAAQNAVVTAITALQDALTVGAIFFPTVACAARGGPGGPLPGGLPADLPADLPIPGAGPGGPLNGAVGGPAVEPIDGPTQIPFQPAAQFLQAWQNHWAQFGMGVNIGTPMQEAFDRAHDAIQATPFQGGLAVVAFTDGQPNCFPGPDAMTETEPNRAASWLADKMIKTYVVGLPGAQGVQILNDVAVSGGTMQYLLPDDPAAIEAQLRTAAGEAIKMGFDSCSINLTPAADPADKLQMVVEEKGVRSRVDHMLSADAGWTITPDGTHVEITGRLCEDAKAGRFDAITFEYGCKELPPLKPQGPI